MRSKVELKSNWIRIKLGCVHIVSEATISHHWPNGQKWSLKIKIKWFTNPPMLVSSKKTPFDVVWLTLLLLVRIRSSNLRSRTKMRNVAMGWGGEKKCVPKSPWQLNLINVALSFCLLYRTRTDQVLQYLFTFKRYITVNWSFGIFWHTVWRIKQKFSKRFVFTNWWGLDGVDGETNQKPSLKQYFESLM